MIAQTSRKSWLKRCLKLCIFAVVVFAVGQKIWSERNRIAEYRFDLSPSLLVASSAAYAVGLAAFGGFWCLAMRDREGRATWQSVAYAYFFGHLAKYVPGKGLVLIIRATVPRGEGVGVPLAAITAFQETILMMGVGAAVAFAAAIWIEPSAGRTTILGMSALIAVALCALSSPAVSGWLSRFALRPFPGVDPEGVGPCRWRAYLAGIPVIMLGWVCWGASLSCLLHAMGVESDAASALGLLTLVVSFATVGGFVTLTPGGLGAREWIASELLGGHIGTDKAIVAVVLLRLVWIATESVGTLLFYLLYRVQLRSAAASAADAGSLGHAKNRHTD